MPAEKIRTETEISDANGQWSRPFEVTVGWFTGPVLTSRGTKQGTVQIAVNRDDQPEGEQGYTTQLNRLEINRLIRALRKARDRAYGQDA